MKSRLFTLLFAGAAIFASYNANACTNFLITKGATKDGSTMISYSADSHTLYGELYHWPAKKWPAGSMLEVYEWDTGKFLGKIPQVAETFEVIGNMNEFQVSIGETTFTGREELQDTTGLIDYGSLIYITLQRAKTAREAIKIMTELVATYGYYSTGESFSIADPNEVWIMEMIGKGTVMQMNKKTKQMENINKGANWVARLIPDGYISGHANQARITTFPLAEPNSTMYSADIIKFARAKGYFTSKVDAEFSFVDAFAPLGYGGLRFCEARVWSGFRKVDPAMDKYVDYVLGNKYKNLEDRMPLWVKPVEKLDLNGVKNLMRDYYQGTKLDMTNDIGGGAYNSPVRWRPMTWEVDGVGYCHERAISTQQTGFSFVAQMRSWLPAPIGGIIWFGVDDTYLTVYTPMYCGIRDVPKSFAVGTGNFNTFTWDAAFWVFNWVSNYTYTRFSDMIKDVQKVQSELENKFVENTANVDAKALELYKQDPEKARQYLTEYSVAQGDMVTARWKKLGESLIFNYLDGNPKDANGKVTHPKYNDNFYRTIIKENPERFKTKKLE